MTPILRGVQQSLFSADQFASVPEADPGWDPGPLGRRGVITGQQVMNFDRPEKQLEEGGLPWNEGWTEKASPAATLVREDTDPDYDDAMWSKGGAARGERRIWSRWESAPVEIMGSEAQLRTGQPIVSRGKVLNLRYTPPAEWHAKPWIARIGESENPKNYILEGHHRVTAARTSGSGEFPAHVLSAPTWGVFHRLFERES